MVISGWSGLAGLVFVLFPRVGAAENADLAFRWEFQLSQSG